MGLTVYSTAPADCATIFLSYYINYNAGKNIELAHFHFNLSICLRLFYVSRLAYIVCLYSFFCVDVSKEVFAHIYDIKYSYQ